MKRVLCLLVCGVLLMGTVCSCAKKPTVTWDLNGGTGEIAHYYGSVADFTVANIPSGEGLAKDGYIFEGWSNVKDSAPMSEVVIINQVAGGTSRFYAVWREDVELENFVRFIDVVEPPIKTAYEAGERFSPSGMVVRATWADNTTTIVSDYSAYPSDLLLPMHRNVTVSYGGVSAQVPISVSRNNFSDKRGVSYNFSTVSGTTLADMDLLWGGGVNGVAWHYNWGVLPSTATVAEGSVLRGLDYFPMAWTTNFNATAIRNYKAENPNCRYILAFNEPNLTDQSNKTPAQAVESWRELVALARELSMEIVSPAMNFGTLENYWDPFVWLDEFFGLDGKGGYEGVSLDDVSAISVHCYMDYPSSAKWFLDQFKRYNKPIWLTEFCAWENHEGNLDNHEWRYQAELMSNIVSYMELDEDIERYAWFIPKGGDNNSYPYNKLLTRGEPQLTELGKVYVNLSVCDTSRYAGLGEVIDASQYTNCNVSEWIGVDGFRNTVTSLPTQDSKGYGALDIVNFTRNSDDTQFEKWVEYQFASQVQGERTLRVRARAEEETKFNVQVDGVSVGTLTIPKGGYAETAFSVGNVGLGNHILRLTCTSGGNIALSYLVVD